MGNKHMLTQRYNTRVLSKTRKTLREKLDNIMSKEIVERDGYDYENCEHTPSWYVAVHNKAKATDTKNFSYTDTQKSKYYLRHFGNIYYEVDKSEGKFHEVGSVEILREQRKLYNKLKHEYEKRKDTIKEFAKVEKPKTLIQTTREVAFKLMTTPTYFKACSKNYA